jgi:hypothetical protein
MTPEEALKEFEAKLSQITMPVGIAVAIVNLLPILREAINTKENADAKDK